MPYRHTFGAVLRTVAILIAGIAIVVVFSSVVPYNMDEFIHYDVILCYLYPGNNLHGTCDPYALNLLQSGWILPLRSYGYIGSFTALYYLPLHLVWTSPLAARFLGLATLAAGAGILAYRFRFSWLSVVSGMLLCFPYAFQHLVDTGPIGYHILSVYLLLWVFERWMKTLRTRYALLTALIIATGIWTKLSYAWLLPSLGLLFLYIVWRERRILYTWRNTWCFAAQITTTMLTTFLLVGTLFLSTHPSNSSDRPLLESVRNSSSYSISELFGIAWKTSFIPERLYNPLSASHRIYEVMEPGVIGILYFTLAYLMVPITLLYILAAGTPRRRIVEPAVYYGLFLLAVTMIVRTKDSSSMHHAILAYPFLILSIFSTIRCAIERAPRLRSPKLLFSLLETAGAAFVGVNIACYVLMPTQKILDEVHPSLSTIHTLLSTPALEQRYTILPLDWGFWFYHGLYGHGRQSVLDARGLADQGRLQYFRSLAAADHRKLLFVFRRNSSGNIQMLRENLSLIPCPILGESSVWTILAEPDPELERACAQTMRRNSLIEKVILGATMMF